MSTAHATELRSVEWNSTGEALVYDEQGNGLQGLSGGNRKEDWRREFVLKPEVVKKGPIRLYLEASVNGMTGNDCGIDPPVVRNRPALWLFADLRTT